MARSADGTSSVRMTARGGAEAEVVEPGVGSIRKLVDVPCRTLTSIMAEAGRPTADLLSLDVEGSEDAVLRTVDPLAFRMILVEFNAGFRAFRNRSLQAEAVRREEWVEQRLLRAGLTRCQKPRIFWSRLYARAAECPSALQHNATLEQSLAIIDTFSAEHFLLKKVV